MNICQKDYFAMARMIALTSNRIEEVARQTLMRHGVSHFSFWVLEALAKRENEKITPTQICEITGGKNANVSRRLDDLVRKKFVKRCDDKNSSDRRKNFFQITPKGVAVFQKIASDANNIQKIFAENLSEWDFTEFQNGITKIRNIIDLIEKNAKK